MVGHGGSSAGSYLADPTSPIPSHCASIVATSTLRVKVSTENTVFVCHSISRRKYNAHYSLSVPQLPLFMGSKVYPSFKDFTYKVMLLYSL